MIQRHFWQKSVESAWNERPIVWLAGVRRAGKTCLSQTLKDVHYYDCELPRVRRMMEDPEAFLEGLGKVRIVLDEIHRLQNPSQLLKIAADHYPQVRILATGSSTLGASSKFKDTLAGRKRDIWLTPMCLDDLEDANRTDLRHRFLYGGLPPFFLAKTVPERDFQEWMDAFWAKDIQELVRIQTEFVQSQMRVLAEQVKDLGDTVSKAAIDSMKASKRAVYHLDRCGDRPVSDIDLLSKRR